MITEKDRTAGFAALNAEKRRDLTRIGGFATPEERSALPRKPFIAATEERRSRRSPTSTMHGLNASRAFAKTAIDKGGRLAAHGHSRHK